MNKPTSAPLGRDFSLLWLGQTVSMVGDQMSAFALPTLAVLTLHASPGEVGLLTAVNALWYPAFGLWAGMVLTWHRARPVMIVTDLVRLAAFLAVSTAIALQVLEYGYLLVIVAVSGVATVFSDIAGQTYLPRLLPADAVLPGNVRLQTSDTLSRVVAPSLSGLLVQVLGYTPVFCLNAASFLISALGLARIRHDEPPPRDRSPEARAPLMLAAARFVWKDRLLRALTVSATIRNFGATASRTVLLPFAFQTLQLSATTVGAALTVGAGGAVLGAFASRAVAHRLGVRRALTITGLEGLAWCLILLSDLASPAAMLGFAAFAASMWLPIWNVVATTVRQSVTPPALQAGVHAVARTVNLSAIPLGALVGGGAGTALAAHVPARDGLLFVLLLGNAFVTVSVAPLFTGAVRERTAALSLAAPAPAQQNLTMVDGGT